MMNMAQKVQRFVKRNLTVEAYAVKTQQTVRTCTGPATMHPGDVVYRDVETKTKAACPQDIFFKLFEPETDLV